MEKLIELLNEWYLERYGTNPHFVRFEDYWGNDYWYFHSSNDENLMVETEVWTKKYWFIKRLVENDKINTNHIDEVVKECWTDWIWAYYCECYPAYESLLMLLSISDEPISDLISYLR